jgi:hypothetical protein
MVYLLNSNFKLTWHIYVYCNIVFLLPFQMDVGMVEFVGLVEVNIVRGLDLAVRDVMSSDPYVMINLGHQVSKYYYW